MTGWIALSDKSDLLVPQAENALLQEGAFIIELVVPLRGPQVLLDYRCTKGWVRALSVLHDDEGGLRILHRQGQSIVRHILPGPLPQEPGIARIILLWDGPSRRWTLRYERAGQPDILTVSGKNPVPMGLDDLRALCPRDGIATRHPAVLWFGVTSGDTPPERAPWLGLRTPIRTPTGPRAAGALRVGDMVMTRDAGAQMLRSVRHMDLPSRGAYAPVLLRAPYFGTSHDLLVSADQMILLDGAEVEYLFGQDEVLAQAQHLTDGTAAIFDQRRAVTSCVSLDLGYPDLIESLGCAFASAQHDHRAPEATAPRHVLRNYEAVPLMVMQGRGNSSRAA